MNTRMIPPGVPPCMPHALRAGIGSVCNGFNCVEFNCVEFNCKEFNCNEPNCNEPNCNEFI